MIDYFRSRSARQVEMLSLDEVALVDETDFVIQMENHDFTERVCAFVGNLPPDTQKIFRLHIFGGHTFAEIANNMEMPESSVKSKYYRLLGTLRKEFNSYDE